MPGLSPIWLMSLAMVLGTIIITFIPIAISGGDAIKASDWIGFAGNVVAGTMTIITAMVAWRAVQDQIRTTLKVAMLPHEQAEQAIDQEMLPLLQGLNEIWKLLSDTVSMTGSVQTRRVMWLGGTIFSIPPVTILDDIDSHSGSLAAPRRGQFRQVMERLRIFYKLTDSFYERVQKQEVRRSIYDLRMMERQLVLLRDDCSRYNEAWSQALSSHPNVVVGRLSLAEQIQNEYEILKMEESHDDSEGEDQHLGNSPA